MIDIKMMIQQIFSESDCTLNEKQVEQFQLYNDLLLEWNEKINLTGITEPREVIIKHFLDSILINHHIKIDSGQKLIDVGTGAGFPGFPLKIMEPGLKLTLLDSLNKRINYLKEVGNAIGANDVMYVHGRAEDIGNQIVHREQYDFAVARAVANLSILLELCIPFVKVGGYFIAYKGRDIEYEVISSKSALKELGAVIDKILKVNLPMNEGERHFIIIKKVRATPKKYPRKAGTPSKDPL